MNKFLKKQTIEEQNARKTIMEVAYLLLAVFLLFIVAITWPQRFDTAPQVVSYAGQVIIGIASLISFVFSRRGYTMVGAYFLPSGLLLLTVYSGEIGNTNALFFITIIVIASVTIGIRGAVLFGALSAVSVIGLYFAQANGLLASGTEVSYLNPIVILAHILGDTAVLIALIGTFNNNLHRALEANKELRQLQSSLEQRIADRTRDLQVASDVSRQITRVLDMDVLLSQLVEKTRQGFNLYYVSLFLYDEQTQELLLEASTGSEGDLMKSEAKAFHVSARPSLVAQAARECSDVIVNDVEQSEAYLHSPYLPETASEAVFPMLVGDRLVGVLDLGSKEKDFFGKEETQIFATLAEQIGVAVRNAELFGLQLRVAEELRRSDLMKSQFLASMSHELRTPLNAIINFTQLIAMGAAGPVTQDQASMLNTTLNSSRHLLQLINDVLDIAKIQAGKLSLYIEEDVNLHDEINAVINMAEPLLQKQNAALEQPIQFVQDIDNDLPLITCDRRRIRQALLNLLSNAIKFTEKGSVTLSVKNREEEVVFAVMDTGHGVPEEMQKQIFEPFVQTADGIKHAQGTGLGLPITRSLIQAHGGDLWMESRVGEGSTFFFTLPFHPSTNYH